MTDAKKIIEDSIPLVVRLKERLEQEQGRFTVMTPRWTAIKADILVIDEFLDCAKGFVAGRMSVSAPDLFANAPRANDLGAAESSPTISRALYDDLFRVSVRWPEGGSMRNHKR